MSVPQSSPSFRKFTAIFVGTLIMAQLLYLGAANLFLRSSLFSQVVNSNPQSLKIQFSSAYSLLPGLAFVEDFTIEGQSGKIKWRADIKKLRVVVNIFALLGRSFQALSVRAEGGSFALDFDQADFPQNNQDSEAKTSSQQRRPFTVEISAADIKNIHDIRIGDYRFQGQSHIKGNLFLIPGQQFRLPDSEIEFLSGEAFLAKENLLVKMQGRVQTHIDDWFPQLDTLGDLVDRLNGQIDLQAQVTDAEFLNYYFQGLKGLNIGEVSGDFKTRTLVRKGVVQPGSHGQIEAQKMGAGLGPYTARGAGKISWDFPKDVLLFGVTVQNYAVGLEQKKNFMSGKSLSLKTGSRDARLRRIFSESPDLDASLEIPAAHVSDMTFINNFIPGDYVKVTGGSATLSARLNVSTTHASAPGFVDVQSEQTQVQYKDMQLSGNISFHSPITDTGKGTQSFNVSRSEIALKNFKITKSSGGSSSKPWQGFVRLKEASLQPRGAEVLKGQAELQFDDARPLLTILAVNSRAAKTLSRFADIKNLQGESHFILGPGHLEFRALRAKSSDLNIEGELRFLKNSQNILALIQFGILEVALDMRDGKTQSKIIKARKWYHSRPPWTEAQSSNAAGDSATRTPDPRANPN